MFLASKLLFYCLHCLIREPTVTSTFKQNEIGAWKSPVTRDIFKGTIELLILSLTCDCLFLERCRLFFFCLIVWLSSTFQKSSPKTFVLIFSAEVSNKCVSMACRLSDSVPYRVDKMLPYCWIKLICGVCNIWRMSSCISHARGRQRCGHFSQSDCHEKK